MRAFEFPLHPDETLPTRFKATLLARMAVAAHDLFTRFCTFDAFNRFPAFGFDRMLTIKNFLYFYIAIDIFRKLVTFQIRLRTKRY